MNVIGPTFRDYVYDCAACSAKLCRESILVDLKLFITQAFDAILLVLPIYVLVCFIKNGKIVFRRLRFNAPDYKV